MRICSHLPKRFFTENLFFCALSRQKTTVKKKITYFFEKSCCLFVRIFWKKLCNLRIFYRSVFRCKVLKPFVILFAWSSIHGIDIFFFVWKKYLDLVVISNKARGRNFCSMFTKSQKLCLHKYLTLVWPLKLIALNFTFLYSV